MLWVDFVLGEIIERWHRVDAVIVFSYVVKTSKQIRLVR